MTDIIKFWLGRVSEEFVTKAKALLDETLVINYQILNFDKMRTEVQQQVLNQLYYDMLNLGWSKEATEIRKHFNNEVENE